MKHVRLISFAFGILMLAGCNPSKSDAGGSPSTPHRRIVSLTPALTRQLIVLGAGDLLVGHSAYCTDCELPNSQVVSSGLTINAERIALLAPDTVVYDSLMPARQVAVLKQMGLRTRAIRAPKSFDDQLNNFIEIGRLAGKASTARQMAEKQRTRLARIMAKIPEQKTPLRMFLQLGSMPLYAASNESFLHDYMRFAQGVNIAADTGFGAVNREFVLQRNPQVIIIATTGQVGTREKAVWEQYTHMDAVKNNRILVLDADTACSPAPHDFVNTLARIVAFVYGVKN